MKRAVLHDTFTIERTYEASPERVFQAWADPKAKAKWFVSPPGWKRIKDTHDFRVGGTDVSIGQPPGGAVISFESKYYDIVENNRIIYAYEMSLGEQRMSVSLATIEFHALGAGTRMVLTESGAYLDGQDNVASRKRGTEDLMDALGRSLTS